MDRRLAVPLAVLVSSCVWTYQSVRIAPLERPSGPRDSVAVTSPVKAHLADGSTVVFPMGVRFVSDTIWGLGMRYDLTLRDSAPVQALALDSVVGMEAFRTHVDGATSTIVSLVATGGVILGAAAAIVAISCINDPKCFGSCPTYYSDSAGAAVLEAEGFSYSIAPLFEARDVDRLRLAAVRDGAV